MRDFLITFVVFASLPIILRRPDVGVVMWTWLSLMNPHRLSWGFAVNMPFAQMVGIALLLSLFFWKEPKRLPWSPLLVIWLLFILWMCFTTLFAMNPDAAFREWDRAMKIQIATLIILMVMTNKVRLLAFVWTVALSIGFFGIKGGVFTIATGGSYLVFGPPGSFIAENNALALSLVVVTPLFRFIQLSSSNKWIRRAMIASMILCVASVIGSHSRGAFLALAAMGMFMVMKSRGRVPMIILIIVFLPIAISFVPEKYWDRMETIERYEEDDSAMGRINAWRFAINIASERPFVGGGYNVFSSRLFKIYAPDPDDFHDVHSIYFEVLGEHGYVGLVLYLSLAFLAYFAAGWTARKARGDPRTQWQADLATMTQVSLVGFAVGGAFLGLAYFDLPYNILAIIVLNRLLLQRHLADQAKNASNPDSVDSNNRLQNTPVPGWTNPEATR